MSTYTPPRPTGNGPSATFCKWVWDELTRNRTVSTPNALVNRTTRGDSVIPLAQKQAQGGSTDYTPVWS